MPLLSKVTQIGGALYSAGSAAVTTYKEQKAERAPSSNHAIEVERSSDRDAGRKRPGEQTELYEVLSSLIQGVYAADRGKANASLFWEPVGYEKEALKDDEAATDEEIAAVGNPACKIRLMVFRRRDDDAATAVLPKIVIAIRGTRKYCQRDVLADLQILCETLHHNPLYDIVKTMTRRVVEKHSHDVVCVAGHSLGAAIGLIVTRELALEDMAVETHLFNPPFFSLETLMEKFTSLGARGMDKLNQALGSQRLASHGPSCRVRDLVKAKQAKRDAEYREAMATEFAKLGKWSPSLYVNPHDTICNGYIDYFTDQNAFYKGRDALAFTLTAGTLRRHLSLDSHSYHLIPTAHLWINHRGDNVLKAHPLDQWHEHPTVDLRHEKHDLLADSAASEKLLQHGEELVHSERWSCSEPTNAPRHCSVASKTSTGRRHCVH